MMADLDFMARDLPEQTDFDDEDATYGAKFLMLLLNDDDYQWPRILGLYQDSSEENRRLINEIFVSLVGYTLPSIVEIAMSSNDD